MSFQYLFYIFKKKMYACIKQDETATACRIFEMWRGDRRFSFDNDIYL